MQKDAHILVAIDGPAGAGKTTVAKKISQELDILYLNTGAMYRAAGLHAYKNHIDPLNEKDVLTFLSSLEVDVKYENGEQHTLLNGQDVTKLLSDPIISEYASKISSLVSVREKMVHLQQQLSKKQSLIIDGRDIGTVVLPNATNKFFLDAKVEERAKRRHFEYLKNGENNISYEQILTDMKERDYRDTTREHSPLKKADDAVYIDSTNMTIDQVVNFILSYFKR
ncbi:MAG: cytidylate kinase [Tenericutes bacterium HGW-Tenericutes-4]|nr:MAG: cytidylate kinase [Tenericutes bacterium HGW-Tenericutes-4]